jgi:hypothetical protein
VKGMRISRLSTVTLSAFFGASVTVCHMNPSNSR